MQSMLYFYMYVCVSENWLLVKHFMQLTRRRPFAAHTVPHIPTCLPCNRRSLLFWLLCITAVRYTSLKNYDLCAKAKAHTAWWVHACLRFNGCRYSQRHCCNKALFAACSQVGVCVRCVTRAAHATHATQTQQQTAAPPKLMHARHCATCAIYFIAFKFAKFAEFHQYQQSVVSKF